MRDYFDVNRNVNDNRLTGSVTSLPVRENDRMKFTMETRVLKDNKVLAFPHVIETKDEGLMGILTKMRVDDIVYVKGPISGSRSIIAAELINFGNQDINDATLVGTVKKAPIAIDDGMRFVMETKEPRKNQTFIINHVIETTEKALMSKMSKIRTGDVVLVQGLIGNGRIIAENLRVFEQTANQCSGK
jgi:hypothetical protein